MFQQLTVKKCLFMAAEPKRPREGEPPTKPKKKKKDRSPLAAHLHKIKKALKKVSKHYAATGARTDIVSVIRTVEARFMETKRQDNVVLIAGILSSMRLNLETLGASTAAQGSPLGKLWETLTASLPGDIVKLEDLEADSSDEEMDAAHCEHGSQTPNCSECSLRSSTSSGVEESKEPTSSRNIKKKPLSLIPVGSKVLVKLTVSKLKKVKHKLARELLAAGSNGMELVMSGKGLGTVSFIYVGQDHKASGKVMPRDEVSVEAIEGVPEPDALLPHMLLEVNWEAAGVSKWYPCKYAPANSGEQGVIDLETGLLVGFDMAEDEWRYPDYPVLVETDEIVVKVHGGTSGGSHRVAIVMEAEDDHTFICEWKGPKLPNDAKNFEIDLYYDILQPVTIEQQDSEATSGEEDEEEDNQFDLKERLEYLGIKYKVAMIHLSEENGIEYDLVPVLSGPSHRVREDVLLNRWSPEFKVGDDIIYEGEAGVVTDLHYESRQYEIELDDADEGATIHADAVQVSVLQDMSLDVGTTVFYDYDYYVIVGDRLTYTLKARDSEVVVSHITERDLSSWVLLVRRRGRPVNEIVHIVKGVDGDFLKGKGDERKPYYRVVGLGEKKGKDIVAGTDNIKYQSDAKNYFVEGDGSDSEAGNGRIEFHPGELVSIIHAGSGLNDKQGRIMRLVPSEDIDDEHYIVNIDGVEEAVHVGSLAAVHAQQSEPEDGEDFDPDQYDVNDETSSEEESENEEVEDESHFSGPTEENHGDYVQLKDADGKVYEVIEASHDVYTIVSLLNSSDEIEDVSVEDLVLYTDSFKNGQSVLFNFALVRIKNVNGDGTYELTNGEENVPEDELTEAEIFKKGTHVSVSGSREVFKVVSLVKGVYMLANTFDGEKTKADLDEVDKKEEPEYEKKEWVQLPGWQFPKQVVSVNSTKFSYKLKGDATEYRESQLVPGIYVSSLEVGNIVNYEGSKYKIKAVCRERGTYILKDVAAEVPEDELDFVSDE